MKGKSGAVVVGIKRRKHSEWKKFKFKSKKAENIQSILGMHFWNI